MLSFNKVGLETWVGWVKNGMYTVQRSGNADRKFFAAYTPRMVGRHALSKDQRIIGRFDDVRHAITAAHTHYDMNKRDR